jgi:spermidine/putrescine transport system permease protein
LAGDAKREGRWAPYGLLSPGILWLLLFFFVPLATLLRTALSVKKSRFEFRPTFSWQWSNVGDAIDRYSEHLGRSFFYAGVATVLCIAIGYPLAYFIAFRGGPWKNVLLGLIVVPFFTSFLIRTLAWKNILADEGPVVGVFRALPFWRDDFQLLSTPSAVIGGLTYNFLPFMVLPIYVSLEKIDVRLLDAAGDLYSTPRRAFRKVVLPLSLPGVFAGTLLTFIPAAGDFVNAEFLGSPRTQMIGNVVQDQFLVQNNFPLAAALSLILMGIITVAVLVYTRLFGTEGLSA